MNSHPQSPIGRPLRTALAVWGAFLPALALMPCLAEETGEPRIYRYAEYEGTGADRVLIQNYRFEDRLLITQAPPNWSSFESEAGDFIHFQHRSEPGAAIEIRFTRLDSVPQDAAAATALCSPEIEKIFPSAVVLRTSPDERYTPNGSLFPLTFILAKEAKGPLAAFCTFFVQPPYLYTVTLEIPPSHPKVKAAMIGDYSTLLRNLRIQPRVKETTPPENGNAAATPSDGSRQESALTGQQTVN